MRAEHDEHVIQMNEVRRCASGWVQRAAHKVATMIDEPRPSDRPPLDPLLKEETTMLKTISAALLAASVIAAPVMAASSDKTTQAPAAKAAQVKPKADAQVKPKADAQVKPNALNANAKMGRHHVKHVRHHRAHKKMSALKTHQFSKASIKQAPATTKRG
jgi:hypothetical protein